MFPYKTHGVRTIQRISVYTKQPLMPILSATLKSWFAAFFRMGSRSSLSIRGQQTMSLFLRYLACPMRKRSSRQESRELTAMSSMAIKSIPVRGEDRKLDSTW